MLVGAMHSAESVMFPPVMTSKYQQERSRGFLCMVCLTYAVVPNVEIVFL